MTIGPPVKAVPAPLRSMPRSFHLVRVGRCLSATCPQALPCECSSIREWMRLDVVDGPGICSPMRCVHRRPHTTGWGLRCRPMGHAEVTAHSWAGNETWGPAIPAPWNPATWAGGWKSRVCSGDSPSSTCQPDQTPATGYQPPHGGGPPYPRHAQDGGRQRGGTGQPGRLLQSLILPGLRQIYIRFT